MHVGAARLTFFLAYKYDGKRCSIYRRTLTRDYANFLSGLDEARGQRSESEAMAQTGTQCIALRRPLCPLN